MIRAQDLEEKHHFFYEPLKANGLIISEANVGLASDNEDGAAEYVREVIRTLGDHHQHFRCKLMLTL